jgi:endonuclease/exonuclease/phosphatase family metal-dependent hydrolase
VVILLPNISACRNSKIAASATGDPSGVIRVMSYNIHHANPPSKAKDSTIDMQAIADVIIKANPDLVALQEVDNRTTRSGVNLNQEQEL